MKKMIMNAKASLAALLALLLLVGMLPAGMLTATAAPTDGIIFQDDFESGNLDQWTMADGMDASVKPGIGKDFSKGLAVNEGAGKWSTLTHYFTVEPNTYYEISFDYYESTNVESVQVQIRYQSSSDKLYNTDRLENTKGQWVHYSGTFYTEELTDLRLLIVTDGALPANDKAFDNFVIREYEPSVEYGETAFEDDFESSEVGTTGRWQNAQSSTGVIKAGVGTDLSKGMVANGPKWSRIRTMVTLKANTYYEISYDYYESTNTAMSSVMLRVKDQNPIVDVYYSGAQGTTKGEWVHYSEVIYTEEFTVYWLMMQFDGDTVGSDKTYDNFLIREVTNPGDLPDEPEDPGLVFANGDFETGDFTGWEAGSSMEIVSDNVYDGSYAAQVTGGQWAGLAQYVDVKPDTDYRLTFWARYGSGSGEHTFYLMDGTASSNLDSFTIRVGKNDGWKQFEYVFNSGENTKVLLKFCVTNPKAVYVYDNVTFVPLGEVSFDGYLYNGDFEVGNKGKWEGGGSFDIVTDAYEGKYAIHVKGDNYANMAQQIPVKADTEYSVIVWAKKASGNGKFAILYKDKNQIKNLESFYIDPTDEWARYAVTFNTGNYADGYLLLMADSSTNTAYVDNVTVMEGKPVNVSGLISNGDFESGDLTKWENVGSEAEVVDTDVYEGTYALHLKGKQWSAVRQSIDTVKNTEYVLTFYVKRLAGYDKMAVWLKDGDNNLLDPDGKEIGLKYSVTEGDDWLKVEHHFNSFDQTKIDVLFGLMADGNEVLIDNISLEKYTKPVVAPLPLLTFGVVNNRPKTEADNLIVNGGFESTEGAQWNTYTFLNEHLSVVEDPNAKEGNKVLYFNSTATENTMQVFWVDVEPDTNYIFSAFVKGAYWSAQNNCYATFGVVDPDTETFMIYNGERGKNSKAYWQLVPPSWDNDWHLRSVSFNSGEKTKVGIAVYGAASQMYLDGIALYKNENGVKYSDARMTDTITTNIKVQHTTCTPENNLVDNFNLSDAQDTFWSTGLGWKNGFVSIRESQYDYGNSLQYVGSDNAMGVRYIKWIDVKPNTEYTFSADILVLEDGDGYLEVTDSKISKPVAFVIMDFKQEAFGEEWSKYCVNFKTGVYTRVGITIVDKGGEALIDNIRIFEADAGAEVEDEFVEMKNGWYKAANGKWTYYQDDVQVKGKWIKDGGAWYYIGADGYMVSEKWQKDSNGWCYLTASGKMATNAWIKDSVGWCYVGADGYCKTNAWVKDSKGWCYLDKNGRMVYDKWVHDGVGWAYVDAKGYCMTNKWMKDSKGWCYLGANGYMATNKWIKDSVGWCYVGKDGRMVTNQWIKDSVGWCYVGKDGRMITKQWIKDSVGWCYIGEDGYCVTDDWVADSKGWCYLDENGRMVCDTMVGDYYVDKNGYLVG
ncbi:MAG: carbohydrate binding domain-containing protein [Clostridia bacterium]|nr:carbohydrate binding domain-containing protein [Clostridia bacterium]